MIALDMVNKALETLAPSREDGSGDQEQSSQSQAVSNMTDSASPTGSLAPEKPDFISPPQQTLTGPDEIERQSPAAVNVIVKHKFDRKRRNSDSSLVVSRTSSCSDHSSLVASSTRSSLSTESASSLASAGSPMVPLLTSPSSSVNSSTSFGTKFPRFIRLRFDGSHVDFSGESRLQVVYRKPKASPKLAFDQEQALLDSSSSSSDASPVLPEVEFNLDVLGDDLLVDSHNEESFTLESFLKLIVACYRSRKHFLLARVTTIHPSNPSHKYYSYYDAQHLNKVLFTVQPERQLLHRMRAKNPLNNMPILGNVQYFYIDPQDIDHLFANDTFSDVEKLNASKKSNLKGKLASDDHLWVFNAVYFGNDQDYLTFMKIRNFFDENSVKPKDHALLTLDQLYSAGPRNNGSSSRSRVVVDENGQVLDYSDIFSTFSGFSRPQSSIEYAVGFCGIFDAHSVNYRRKVYVLAILNYLIITTMIVFFWTPNGLQGIVGTAFIVLMCILVILFLENDRIVSINQAYRRAVLASNI